MAVPKLRFKEFKDEWKTIKLKQILSFKNGINANKDSYVRGIKYISVGDILNNTFITYDKIKGLVDINKKILNENSVEYGDIIFQRSSETFNDIGQSNVYLDKEKVATFGGFVIRGKKIGDYNPLFLNYLLKSPYNRKKIIIKGAGAQHYNISQEELEKININCTKENEQEKIANLFSLLDKKIELQKQKIEALKIYKIGLIAKFFNSLNCDEKQIKDIGIVITGTTPSKDNSNYWHNGNITWVTPSDITESKNIYSSKVRLTQLGLNVGRKLPKNSLLITCIASIGKNAILKVAGSCNQQINAIIPNNDCDIDFLYYLFEHKKAYMQSITGTSATSIINKSSFEKIFVKIPTIDVQKNISKTLSAIDHKIDLQNCLLENLTHLKKYLLQQMFI